MDRTFAALSTLFFIGLTVLLVYVMFSNQFTQITRASQQTADPENSIILAWPLAVPADGEATSDLTVFVRDQEGRVISNKVIDISTSLGTLTAQQSITNSDGEARFQLTSTEPGIAEIRAVVDNREFNQTVTIAFE